MVSDSVSVARRLVEERFPDARSAWLGGNIAVGEPTPASDLDITVLLSGSPAPYRASIMCEDWPIELFVQTERSLLRFCADDCARRRAHDNALGRHACGVGRRRRIGSALTGAVAEDGGIRAPRR
jgi:hypothetical protein